MKYLAIRDDDLTFFTQPTVLEALYGAVFPRVPISFGCVSQTVAPRRDSIVYQSPATPTFYPLADNRKLCDYIRSLLNRRQCEVMVHGYTHEDRRVQEVRQPECIWKKEAQLTEEIAAARDYLTGLFGLCPRVFIPPDNAIGAAGVRAASAAGLDLSALLSLRPDRPWSSQYLDCYRRRWTYALLHRRPYPFPLDFGTHHELVAYPLSTTAAFEDTLSCLQACAEADAPFVLATRCWQLADDEGLHSAFLRVIDAALDDFGYLPATVSDAIAGRRLAPKMRASAAP